MAPAKPMTDEHYELLRWLSNDFQRARDIAAELYGITTQEAMDSGKSTEVSRLLLTMRAWGFVERDYYYVYGDTARCCCYRLSDKGRDWLSLAQAA